MTSPLAIGYALWGAFVLSWNVSGRWTAAPTERRPVPGRERLHELVLACGLVLIVLAPVTAVAHRLWTSPPVLDWLALSLVAIALAWCWWARLHLGRLWSARVTLKEGHRVVQTGPYRLVRHPVYTGFIACYLGLAALCATAFGFSGLALVSAGLWLKARAEERFLADTLKPGEYDAYRRRTPMLLPGFPRTTAK